MQALITLAAPPGEMGRVLAGLSVLESLAVALRSPMFVPLFNATLEKVPGAVWWLSAVRVLLRPALSTKADRVEIGHIYDVQRAYVLPASGAVCAVGRDDPLTSLTAKDAAII